MTTSPTSNPDVPDQSVPLDESIATPAELAEQSPLIEADVASLDELMSRDPLTYSDEDITEIARVLRAQRHRWNLEETTAKSNERRANSRVTTGKTPKKPAKVSVSKEEAAAITVDDLDITL